MTKLILLQYIIVALYYTHHMNPRGSFQNAQKYTNVNKKTFHSLAVMYKNVQPHTANLCKDYVMHKEYAYIKLRHLR